MHSMTLHIEDDFYNEFMQMIDSLVTRKKIAYSPIEIKYQKSIVVHDTQAIKERLNEAKEGIAKGNYLQEKQFWEKVDKHLESL